METVTGIFASRVDAERAVQQLQAARIANDRISFLAPDTRDREIETEVPVSDTEQSGMGKAMGGAVGGALGAASGLGLGAGVASLLVPGVGPVLAAGVVGAAILGIGGAATGMAAGAAMPAEVERVNWPRPVDRVRVEVSGRTTQPVQQKQVRTGAVT